MKNIVRAITAALLLSLSMAAFAGTLTHEQKAKADELGNTPTPRKIAELRTAADKGEAWAQLFLGTVYAKGKGVPRDKVTAANLGLMYSNGDGVPENAVTAVKWYTKAAEQGYAKAQYKLGGAYTYGGDVPEDNVTAVKWYTKAAEQGYRKAQFYLGYMYSRGEGVPEDSVMAYMWFNLAAAQGHPAAKSHKNGVQDYMTPADISKAQTLSRECLAKDYKNCG